MILNSRKMLDRPRIAYIPKGLTVDYEKEYAWFFDQEVNYVPENREDFLCQFRLLNRWQEKSVPQIIGLGRPDAAYAIAIESCRHIPMLLGRNDLQEYIARYKTRIRKMIEGSFSALVTAVKAWNNEEKRRYVCNFIFEQSKLYDDFRGLQKTLMQMMPSEAIIGEPIPVTREMNTEELFLFKEKARRKEIEERKRIEAEKEAKSLIPLNPDYEERIFNLRNLGWDCDMIAHEMYRENNFIRDLGENSKYQDAVLKFLQLTKSLCRHFISDEHYNYFDDMYSPEYALDELVEYFNQMISSGVLPDDAIHLLEEGWNEILETECYRDYGIPQVKLNF